MASLKMQDSVKLVNEMNAKTSEMDSENFESLEHVECAFRELRKVLPQYENGESLSEFEVLKLAMEYIHVLEELLHFETSSRCQ